MKKNIKTKILLLNIVTLGLFSVFLNAKAKKRSKHKKNQLNTTKVDGKINIPEFIEDLGGKNNIKKVTYTIHSINITLLNYDSFDMEYLNQLKLKYDFLGISATADKFTFLVGDYAENLAKKMSELIS